MIFIDERKLLQFALERDMINLSIIEAEVNDMERKELLKQHTGKIWQGKNDQWYTYLDKKLVKRTSRKALEDFLADHYRKLIEEPTFREVFNRWVQQKLDYGEVQKSTYDYYIITYHSLIEGTWLDQVKLPKLTDVQLEDFIKRTIKEKELSSKRWSNLRIIISGTVRYAKKHGYTNISMRVFLDELDISKRMFHNKEMIDEEEVFTHDEIMAIKKYVLSRDPSIVELGVLLGIETGMRRGEISALKKCDIDGDILHVRRTEIRFKDENGKFVFDVRDRTKGRDGKRDVIMTDLAQKIIRLARSKCPFGEYVFMKDGERIKGDSFTKRIKKLCKTLKFLPRPMHKVRKTYATNLINAGVDDKLVELQMGHTQITTTKRFYYFNNKTIDESKKIIQSALA